jgi:preprotein translocase subunit YajC
MLSFALLVAQNAQAPEGPPPWTNLILLGSLAVLMYFIMFRPMRQQEKQRQAMVAALKKNDKVVTSGGIIGVVTSIKDKDDEVVLRLEEGRIRVTKSSIARVLTASSSGSEEEKDKEES